MRTVSVALVACLNIGVDPPDVVKPQPCARLECWADPLAMPPQKALDTIGNTLQLQYERWQPRVRVIFARHEFVLKARESRAFLCSAFVLVLIHV